VVAVALAVFLVAALVIVQFVPDDSYISFRYAENLSSGNGLTYNGRDAPVEGYSNFLWILVLSVVDATGLPLPTAAPVVGILIGMLCILLASQLYARAGLSSGSMLLPLLMLATSGPLVVYAVSGLETTLFAFLLLGLVWAVGRIRSKDSTANHIVLALVGVLVALCRPEGVLAFPVIAIVLFFMHSAKRRPLVVGIIMFMVMYAVYTLWRVTYFGDLLPTPFLSKAAGGGGALLDGWRRNLRAFFVIQGQGFPPVGYYVFGLLALGWLGWRRRPFKIRTGGETVAIVLASVYALVYFNFVDWMPGMRYHAPLIPLMLLPAARVQQALLANGSNEPSRSRMQPALMIALVMLVSLSVLMPLRLAARSLEQGSQQCLIPLAEWLKEYGPANPTLAVSDVGAIPYYTGFYTIDINPESLTDRHIAHEGFSETYFYSKKADVLVFVSQGVHMPRFYPEHFALAENDKFDTFYRLIGVARYQWYKDRSYWVYFPLDAPPLSDAAFEDFPAGVGKLRRVQR